MSWLLNTAMDLFPNRFQNTRASQANARQASQDLSGLSLPSNYVALNPTTRAELIRTGQTSRDTGGRDVLGDASTAPIASGFAGGGASIPELNMGAINNTQRAIDQIPGLLQAALAAEATRRNNTLNAFNQQEQGQRRQYDESTTTNQQNYDANYMDSIRAGAGGLSGLMSILRGTGAAGGTAEDLVRNTVGGVTAQDIRSGADTQRANQTELDSVLSSFLTDLKGKRVAAEDTFRNNQSAIRRDSQSQLQDLYGKMAGYYGDAERTAERDSWMAKAGSLTPSIAQNSRASVTPYDAKPVQVRAPELTAFAGASQPDVAVAPRDGQVGSGIFTMNNRRDRERENSPVALSAGV